jgi:hypothetical protein
MITIKIKLKTIFIFLYTGSMRKIFWSVMFILLFSFALSQTTFAADRFATCDACGLCPTIINGSSPTCSVDTAQIPGDWKSCVKCLYPSLNSPDPTTCKTLLINGTTNLPQYPVKVGRQYTMLGCISSGSSVGFTGEKGAPSFVQALLNVIFSFAGGLAFLYLMYGGFIILTSQADPEKLNYGRRLIYGAIAGLIITLGSVFIVNLIGSGILRIPGFSTGQ